MTEEANTLDALAREEIARIVDPHAFNAAYIEAGLRTSERLDALAKADAILSRLSSVVEERDRLRVAVIKAEAWFRDYERQHRAKGTLDGTLKADTNQERADYLRQALGSQDHE